MADGPVNQVLRRLTQLAGVEGQPDHELLDRFVQQADGTAYAALIERHGAMVFGVCRRILAHTHDAEDASQATFLVLARRGDAVRVSVASWLHAVACRVAHRLRAQRTRHPTQELGGIEIPGPDPTADVAGRELRSLIDAELNQLPEKYRAPLVLCYLEGLTQDEAARRLGWEHGVFRGRLDRARLRLRARLTRRGLDLSATLLGAVLAESVATAGWRAPVPFLVQAAQRIVGSGKPAPAAVASRVAALAEGVIQAMIATKLRTTALMLVALMVLVSVSGVLAYRAVAGATPDNESSPQPSAPRMAGPDHVAAGALSGKPLLVMTKNGSGYALEKPELHQLGGRTFVVGKEDLRSKFFKERFSGATIWVPLENVSELVEFNEPAKQE